MKMKCFHNKVKSKQIMSTKEQTVYIETYSEKSFIVRGDTRPHREKLLSLGGKWADRLTDKKTKEKFGAWLFWTAKRKELDTWVEKGCKEVSGGGYKRSVSTTGGSDTNRLIKIEKLLINIEKLLKKMVVAEPEDEPEETKAPKHKRLLR